MLSESLPCYHAMISPETIVSGEHYLKGIVSREDYLKVYLRRNALSSQNVSSEAQVKNFYFVEKLCFVIKIFKFLYFLPSHDLANLRRHDEH